MKNLLLLHFALIFFIEFLPAQGKEGDVWVLGYPAIQAPDDPRFGGSLVTFDGGNADTSRFKIIRSMDTPASIADASGKLLFYSNGCDMINPNHQIMSNGTNINDLGEFYDLYCANEPFIYIPGQEMVILPWPKHEEKYKAIHISYPSALTGQLISELLQTTVDMRLDGGLGEVTERGPNLLTGSFVNGYMTAVRHGNGTDWWITMPEWHTTTKFVFLLDSLGIHGPDIQLNAGILTGSGGFGQAAFSPDGRRYAEICFFQGQVLDFDRCTGKFSNPRVIRYDSLGAIGAGVAFSPDSRFMYVAKTDTIFQFDMEAADFNSTRQVVAHYDGIIADPYDYRNPYFNTMLTAPDGKIYISTPSWPPTKVLHVINEPNKRGPDCDFKKFGLDLPTLNLGQLPNLPNFRLGALDPPCGSGACDTLPQTENFTLFPNPATEYVIISGIKSGSGGALLFQLYDALGRLLIEEHLPCLPHRIELSDLPSAGYFYRVFDTNGEQMDSGVLAKVAR